MEGSKPPIGRTEDHPTPSFQGAPTRRPMLIVAFPHPLAIPLPRSGEAVGRDWLAAVGLRDSQVSGRHLVFSRTGGALQLEDAGSRNGTFVDGRRLDSRERVALTDGVVIRLGATLMVFREDLLGQAAPSPPLGHLVGPYGLRGPTSVIEAFSRLVPRNVLIEGETGTGKELAAAAVAASLGRARPYGAVNVAGVTAGVFESQLFGYVAGAYSGSGRGSRGLVASHEGGTVFLDEIGELPLDLQPKLLRLLENREVMPVGANRPSAVDVLIVAATNRALEELVERGAFRRDLHARLAGARVELPPLRERAEDLFAIAQALTLRRGHALDPMHVEVEAVERLMLYPWRSNVRELASVLDRTSMLEPLPALRLWTVERVLGPAPPHRAGLVTTQAIADALAACSNNETQAAKRLGVSRGKLRRFLAASKESGERDESIDVSRL